MSNLQTWFHSFGMKDAYFPFEKWYFIPYEKQLLVYAVDLAILVCLSYMQMDELSCPDTVL